MTHEPDYVNPGFTEPDDAPPIPDDDEDIGTLLSEVLDLADQEVRVRLHGEDIEERLAHVKRQVSYNPDVILCPDCKKRIRLNNDGRVRKHMKGKSGSYECPGSYASPGVKDFVTKSGRVLTDADIQALADEAEAGYDISKFKSRNLFSDAQ